LLPPGAIFQTGVNEERRLAVRQGLTAANKKGSAELRRLYGSEADKIRPVEVYVVAQDGAILGGAYGTVRWRWFDLDVVWLSDAVRGGGTGRMLMEQVEAAARAAEASAIRLSTLDFQARGFYQKCGYRVYGELPNYPETHTEFLLMKDLDQVSSAA